MSIRDEVLSSSEILDVRGSAVRSLDHIKELEGGQESLNAFLAIADPEDLEPYDRGPLAGVMVALKDNICTKGLPTTCGSSMLKGYRSPYEATVVKKLRRAGGLIAGKTNLDEFGMGSSTENSAFGPTLNPVDRSLVPGGSSGGSAAAVAAGYVRIALGSDTGGSVRQPAAFCGVVGIKPTYGRVSRYGLIAFASSLDQIGTIGATVLEASLLLEIVSGHDARDSTSAQKPVPSYKDAVVEGVEGMVIGIPTEYFPEQLDPSVRALLDEACERLIDAGAEVRPVSLPHTEFAIPCYYVLATAEASSNLARYDGVRFGVRVPAEGLERMYEGTRGNFGSEVKRRIMLGTYVLSSGYYDAYYGTAQRTRASIAHDFKTAFSEVDVLFTPTSPTPAFPLGERVLDPVAMYLSDVFTVTANLAGIPGLSVPIGTVGGLPLGAQLLGPWWGENRIIAAAGALEASYEEDT
ncbi:MAG: Asp-tRNA(Asn)/Glu-tRNA(Gln) amidotransferase subunit GatA [Gemmatimonadetes bacterium]|nr:Asp-tRNA(Asn)/Glu-tRNA(Gln) amidotransferase subunit GatA [Gemmatimonadota bacterium]